MCMRPNPPPARERGQNVYDVDQENDVMRLFETTSKEAWPGYGADQ